MNSFERLEKAIKTEVHEVDDVENLIAQFPAELHQKLYDDIEKMDDEEASRHLITKLINRKFALSESQKTHLPEGVEVSTEQPLAIAKNIQKVLESSEVEKIGEGVNAKVFISVRRPNTCYKKLNEERARQMGSTAEREAGNQYKIWELLSHHTDAAQVPKLIRYVDTDGFRAIHMERVKGNSILEVLEKDTINLPNKFDLDSFIAKLEKAVTIMNENGYFHRDLTNNPGNVMVDSEANPWIIDFGSSIRTKGPDRNPSYYQIEYNGSPYVANDLSGIRSLKQQLYNYIREKERQNHESD